MALNMVQDIILKSTGFLNEVWNINQQSQYNKSYDMNAKEWSLTTLYKLNQSYK